MPQNVNPQNITTHPTVIQVETLTDGQWLPLGPPVTVDATSAFHALSMIVYPTLKPGVRWRMAISGPGGYVVTQAATSPDVPRVPRPPQPPYSRAAGDVSRPRDDRYDGEDDDLALTPTLLTAGDAAGLMGRMAQRYGRVSVLRERGWDDPGSPSRISVVVDGGGLQPVAWLTLEAYNALLSEGVIGANLLPGPRQLWCAAHDFQSPA